MGREIEVVRRPYWSLERGRERGRERERKERFLILLSTTFSFVVVAGCWFFILLELNHDKQTAHRRKQNEACRRLRRKGRRSKHKLFRWEGERERAQQQAYAYGEHVPAGHTYEQYGRNERWSS